MMLSELKQSVRENFNGAELILIGEITQLLPFTKPRAKVMILVKPKAKNTDPVFMVGKVCFNKCDTVIFKEMQLFNSFQLANHIFNN